MRNDESERGTGRERAAFVAFVVFLLCIAARLGHLSLAAGPGLAAAAVGQRQKSSPIPARPGDLLDRRGVLLATTVTAHSLFLAPRGVPGSWREDGRWGAARDALADAAGVSRERLRAKDEANRGGWFLWVRRRLDPAAADRVRAVAEEHDLPAAAWGFRPEFRRHAPLGAVGGSLIGVRDLAGDGVSGLEAALNDRLRGVPGVRTIVRDAKGETRAVLRTRSRPPSAGDDVTLTLDAALQRVAEAELDRLAAEHSPAWSALLVTDPRTAAVLAAAATPRLDPGSPGDMAAASHPAFCRAFEPGSTVKPLFVGAALAGGFADPEEHIDCERGRWTMPNGRVLRDVSPRGLLTPAEILVVSSNVGTAKLAARMGNAELHRVATAFGFGRRTGCGFPGESPGTLRAFEEWTDYSTASVPIGHEFAATCAQLAAAHGALANGGDLIVPSFARSAGGGAGVAPVKTRVLPERWCEWLVAGPLRGVVERGTGRRANGGPWPLFGKTGTAQLWDAAANAYSEDRTVAVAVVGGPAATGEDAPRVLAVCVAYDPRGERRGGGSVAAPAAANAVRFALRRSRGGGAAEDGGSMIGEGR